MKLLYTITGLILLVFTACSTSIPSEKAVSDSSTLSFDRYYNEHDFAAYADLSHEQRASLAEKYYAAMGFGLLQTDEGVLDRYSEPRKYTAIEDLLTITSENVGDHPVWTRDVLIIGSVKSHVPEFSIMPGVTVFFGHDDAVTEDDGNGDWADIEFFGDISFKGTYEERIHFLPITAHPEADVYTSANGGRKRLHNEAAPGIQVLFFQRDSGKVEIEYCVFRDFAHGGLNIMDEESGPIEVQIRNNIFAIRLGLGSAQFGTISGLVENNYFTDPEYSTESLDLYDLTAEDTMMIQNNQIGPVFCGTHWGSVLTPIRSHPRAENNIFFMVPYITKDEYFGDSPYMRNNKFIGEF